MNNIQELLNNILTDYIDINEKLCKDNSMININELYNKIKINDINLNKLKKIINTIQIMQNNTKIIFKNNILKKSKLLKNDEIENENKEQYIEKVKYVNITNAEKYDNIDHMKIPIINISKNNIENIINTPIYFIQETKEYAIKINNKLIKGNIGNILYKDKYKTITCKKKECNKYYYNNKECKYLHNNEVKNFMNYSWNLIKRDKHKGKYDLENSRFIGSLDSLNQDLVYTNKFEKKLRKKQLMHDILIYQILSKYLN